MIYTTGTVSTVSGSAIVSGTGTKWTVNNPAIRSGTIILIKNGNANFIYMVDRVNSDTELVISQPATFTVKNTSYSINLTEPNSYSDANNRMTAIASDTTYFLRAMDQWMMNNGVVTVELSNGQKVTLDSIKKMQGDISNKADDNKTIHIGDFGLGRSNTTGDKHTQNANDINFTGVATPPGSNGTNYWNNYYPLFSMVRGGGNIGNNVQLQITPDGVAYRRTSTNEWVDWIKLLSAGDYGIGSDNTILHSKLTDFINPVYSGFRGYSNDSQNKPALGAMAPFGAALTCFYSPKIYSHIITPNYGDSYLLVSRGNVGETAQTVQVMTSNMWTTDSNGFYKKASPIIDINPDGTFTTNDESEGATVTRVAQGEYLIEGVLGFNADAGWGGVDGGIEIPLDVNKQPLIWVDSEVMEDGSILVRTYHRTHPNAPKFARNDIDGFNDGDPIDIPDGRFISVRVQMPEQSIYNVRMREMEEAQKAEDERRQKEEEMKEQYGLGENDVLL
ncbi:hypothetical protein R2B78_07225 [Proteus mirabilis]|uniref:phage tail fiber protein n=1 Tax=Proteus mirabilis TaxID=584 RepID=UPI002B2D0C96|nr:hypothetical protein R2B78_07225 [Proteus mirabilis]